MGGAQSNAGPGGNKKARFSAAKNTNTTTPEEQDKEQQQQQLELAKLRQRLLRPAQLLPRPLQPEHEKDHALVLDLMEFFCFAVKVLQHTSSLEGALQQPQTQSEDTKYR